MKANFAISLTAERLVLLRRQSAGWAPVGEARFDAPDLDAALATLRRTALGLAPEGLRAKVILPEDQIRYLTAETGDLPLEGRITAARAALDGATPYALDELRFDLAPDGAVTRIAAVAAETLDEAESFLKQHRLGPVSFVAAPRGSQFPGEPFFGVSAHAATLLDKGETVEPDGVAVPAEVLDAPDLTAPAEQPVADAPVDLGRFTSRRDLPPPPPAHVPRVEKPVVGDPVDFAAFTSRRDVPLPASGPVSGQGSSSPAARDTERRTGLALAVGVGALLAGLVLWNALSSGPGPSGLADGNDTASLPATSPAEVRTVETVEPPAPEPETQTAALVPEPADETERQAPGALPAPLAMPAPREGNVAPAAAPDPAPVTLSPREFYARTGIWIEPPDLNQDIRQVALEDLYVTSIDPENIALDAVALPLANSFDTDHPVPAISDPAPHGSRFEVDRRGLVTPSPDGTLSPDGILVYAGKPSAVPPRFPNRVDLVAEAIAKERAILAAFRPRLRPGGLIESRERQKTGGLSFAELGKYRPRLRPDAPKQEAEEDVAPTALAAAESRRPKVRPDGFAKIVAQAEPADGDGGGTVQQASAPVPSIPSSASVTRQATVRNAINLNRINLMGVYGTPSDRRALVRLSNGRFKKVEVGDRLDGGRVTGISENALSYSKGARNIVLEMPKT